MSDDHLSQVQFLMSSAELSSTSLIQLVLSVYVPFSLSLALTAFGAQLQSVVTATLLVELI